MKTVLQQVADVAFALMDELSVPDEKTYNQTLLKRLPHMIYDLDWYLLYNAPLSEDDARLLGDMIKRWPFEQARVQALLDEVFDYEPEQFEALLAAGVRHRLGPWRAKFGLPAIPMRDKRA